MRANVSPEAIKADLSSSSFGTSDLEHASSNSQTGVSGNNLDASNPFSHLTALLSSDCAATGEVGFVLVDEINLLCSLFCQSTCGTQVSEEVSVSGKDIKFILGLLLVLFSC